MMGRENDDGKRERQASGGNRWAPKCFLNMHLPFPKKAHYMGSLVSSSLSHSFPNLKDKRRRWNEGSDGKKDGLYSWV